MTALLANAHLAHRRSPQFALRFNPEIRSGLLGEAGASQSGLEARGLEIRSGLLGEAGASQSGLEARGLEIQSGLLGETGASHFGLEAWGLEIRSGQVAHGATAS